MSTEGSQIAAAETAPHVPRRIDEYLKEVLPKSGSDLHFIAGDPPRIRVYGELQTLRDEPLTQDAGREVAARDHVAPGAGSGSRRRTAPISPTPSPACRAFASTCSATSAASAPCSAPSRRRP